MTAQVDAGIGVPGASNNSAGDTTSLRDPRNFDFRTRAGSYLAETCIGPYGPVGHGEEYVIAGRQEWTASFPVPPHGSTTVPADADLMFLQALHADGHHVYAGSSAENLVLLGSLSGNANVFTPPAALLVPGGAVVWRVDAYDAAGVRGGQVWNFTVATVDAGAAASPLCHTYSSTDTPVAFQGVPGGGTTNGGFDVSFMTLPARAATYAERVEVTSLKVCINMTVNTTLSDWHVRVVARYGKGATWAMHFTELDRWNNPDGVAKTYVDACFAADAAAGKLPWNAADWDAAEPFTGLWEPIRSNLLSGFADNDHYNHSLEFTEVKLVELTFQNVF